MRDVFLPRKMECYFKYCVTSATCLVEDCVGELSVVKGFLYDFLAVFDVFEF